MLSLNPQPPRNGGGHRRREYLIVPGPRHIGESRMHLYTKLFEFAATAGAFEGYVYGKKNINPDELSDWVRNIVGAYQHLPPDTTEKIQTSLNNTLGRAIASLTTSLGGNHELVKKLKGILTEPSAKSADDFQFKKWFQE